MAQRSKDGVIYEQTPQGWVVVGYEDAPAPAASAGQIIRNPNAAVESQIKGLDVQGKQADIVNDAARLELARQAEARQAAADARAAGADSRKIDIEERKLGLGDASQKVRADAIAGYKSAQDLTRLITEMEGLNKAGPGSTSGLMGLSDYLPLTSNQRMDNAGNAARGTVGSALAFTGGQLNTAAEAAMAVGPYLPQASDRDEVRLDKINRLKMLAKTAQERAIAQLGGVPDENGRITPVAAVAPPAPPPEAVGGNGAAPNQPGLAPTSGDERTFYTEKDKALTDEAQAAFVAGADRATIDAIAAKYGRQPFGEDLDKAIANRANNIGVQFTTQPTGREEVGGLSGTVAGALPSGFGSFAAGAGNAATFGQLGNIAQMAGGSEGGTDVGMRLARENSLPFFAGSMFGDTAMALGTGAGLGAVAGKAANPSIAALLSKPLTADVAFGAAQGAGNADDPLYGAVGGAMAGVAGNQAGGFLGSRISGLRTPEGAAPLSRGESAVMSAVNRDGSGAVVDALRKAQSLNVPANLADVSPSANNLTGAAIRRSPVVAGQARDVLLPRSRGQVDRFRSAVERDLGEVGNVPQISQDLMAQAKTAAGPLYDRAYAAPAVGSSEIASLLSTPFGKQALGRAQTIAANERRNPMEMGFSVDDAGAPVLNPVALQEFGQVADARSIRDDLERRLAVSANKARGGGSGESVQKLQEMLSLADDKLVQAHNALSAKPASGTLETSPQYSTQTLDYVKRGMDDVLEEKRNPITGKLVLDEAGRAQNSVLRSLLGEIDTYNPAYAEARSVYAGPVSARDALARGQDAVSLNPNELGIQTATQSPEHMAQMQLGFRSQLVDNAETMRYNSNPFERVLGTPAMEQRLGTMYPGNPNVVDLIAQRDMEGQLAASANRLVGNSMTAERQVADEAFASNPMLEAGLHGAAALATGGASIPGTAARLAGGALKDRLALGLGKRATQKAEQIGPLTLANDPTATLASLRALEDKQRAYDVAKALLASQGKRPGQIAGVSSVAALLSGWGQ